MHGTAHPVKSIKGRHGIFAYYTADAFVGRSLALYGEYSPGEVELFKKLLKSTDTVVDVGANIGALTVPLAKMAETVHAFEPQPELRALLNRNVMLNKLDQKVVIHRCALSDKNGISTVSALDDLAARPNYGDIRVGIGTVNISLMPLDGIDIGKPALIKIDVQGMASKVLRGARQTISKHQPLLYVEDDDPDDREALHSLLSELGYHRFAHCPPMFEAVNYFENPDNAFGDVASINILCVHKSQLPTWEHVTRDLSKSDIMLARQVNTRHGRFAIYDEDELVGLALSYYGEYSESEVEVFRKCLRADDVAIDVGANIGAFTIPMARLVGQHGRVYAFEASRANVPLLHQNVVTNMVPNVIVKPVAASDREGTITVTNRDALHAYSRVDINSGSFEVECITIDSLNLDRCDFIKIDVDRMELDVIRGARETIKRCRPILYVENEHEDQRIDLVAEIVDLGYRCYWHRPYQFNQDNFLGEKRNIFGHLLSIMMLCVPDEQPFVIRGLEEVSDFRQDDLMFDREIARLTKVIERNPEDLNSRMLVGHLHNMMQREDTAREYLEENLRINPDHQPTKAILGLIKLQNGKWKEGWKDYEIRFQQANRHTFGGDRTFDCPKWDGEPTDKPLLIWSEQGFGDNLMFVRLFKHVLERAPNAFLEVRPELYELFEYSKVAPPGKLIRLGRSLPPYELHCSLPSCAAALEAGEDLIRSEPYLFADPLLVQNWLGKGNIRIAHTPEPLCGARIGICNKGGTLSERPFTRDVPDKMISRISRRYGPMFTLNQGEIRQFESFMMTAACMKALDLIITVDTSVAHLAGALGCETWLMLGFDPDFRWGLKGDSCIWYPNMRIFRQPRFRDWDSVIEEVASALHERLG